MTTRIEQAKVSETAQAQIDRLKISLEIVRADRDRQWKRAEDLAAVLADQDAQTRQDWQPIEGAKQDGREVIVFNGRNTGAAYWSRGVSYGPRSFRPDVPAGWVWCGDAWHSSGYITPQPTHFRPLPAPPAQKGTP